MVPREAPPDRSRIDVVTGQYVSGQFMRLPIDPGIG
jgi:hypothetical protein